MDRARASSAGDGLDLRHRDRAEAPWQGFGRQLLAALETEIAGHGCTTIGLNVFADNGIARQLYESAGYEVTSMHMRKRVAAAT